MSLAFSPMQRRCLDALGYILHAWVGRNAGAQSIAPVAGISERESNPYQARTHSPHITTAAPTAAQDARDIPLFAAIVRAAQVRTDTVLDPLAWLRARGVDSIASLRDDPAAKRALWPMLRRERRAR